MTTKAAFNAEEWSTLANAPALAALTVLAAHRGGSVRESLAAQRYYAEAASRQPGELLSAILATPATIDGGRRPTNPDELRALMTDTLRSAIASLERNATDEEVVEYKRFVYGLAEAVARAHKEGGFLGIGGTEISESEQAVLDAIAAIFDQRQA